METESDRTDTVRRWSGRTFLSILANLRLSALGKLRRITTRHHVLESMDEWLALECNSVETIVLQDPKIPQFEFNVKIFNSSKYRRDVYVQNSVITALEEIRSAVKSKEIKYKSTNDVIKFAFNYIDSLPNASKVPHLYPQPVDKHVAFAVVTQLFDTNDVLGAGNADLVVYYYLCVLRIIDHPIVSYALFTLGNCTKSLGVYGSAFVPKCEKPRVQMRYHHLYGELLYFLSLLALPTGTDDDNVYKMTSKIRTRHAEQLNIMYLSVGSTNYKPIHRGEGWQKLTKFFEANHRLSQALVTNILEPPSTLFPLRVIADQVTEQVKQLWRWTGLDNFRDCYEFATSKKRTEAHAIPVIAEQCERVILLYQKLKAAVGRESLIPYAKLLVIDDECFFIEYEAYEYPDLFYASRSYMTPNKLGNSLWEEFVAKTKVTVQRKIIDEKLIIPLSNLNWVSELNNSSSLTVEIEELPLPCKETVAIINNRDIDEEDRLSINSNHFKNDNVEDGNEDHDPEFVLCDYI